MAKCSKADSLSTLLLIVLAELSVARGAGHVEKGGRTPRHFHLNGVADMLASSITAEELFHRAQAKGLSWASVRVP